MPILPPILRAAVETMTGAATRAVVDPLIDIAAASYCPPKPSPPPTPFAAVEVNSEGIITQIFPPAPTAELNARRQHYIDQYEAELRFELVERGTTSFMRIGDNFSEARLRIAEHLQDLAYRDLGINRRIY